MPDASDYTIDYGRHDSVAYIADKPIGGGDTPVLMPRQSMAGNQRGEQVVKGRLRIVDDTGNTIAIIGQL